MARRASVRKTPNTLRLLRDIFSPKFTGTILILVSGLTLLSLMSVSRGRLTDAWIDILQRGFGAGTWALPLTLGSLGLWIVIRSVEHRPHLSWQKPVGILLLYLCFVVVLALAPGTTMMEVALLLSPSAQSAGGWIGDQFGNQLRLQLGSPGAWVVLTVLTMTSIYMVVPDLCNLGLLCLRRWLQALWMRLGEVPPRTRQPHSWGDSWVHRVWLWILSIQIDVSPLRRGYQRWETRYFAMLQRLRARGHTAASVKIHQTPVAPAQVEPTNLAGHGLRSSASSSVSRVPAGLTQESEDWELPDLRQILEDKERVQESDEHIRRCGVLLQETLELFGVPTSFEGAYKGPAVTQYLIKPGFVERQDGKGRIHRTKVKVSKITSLSNDLALAVAAQSVRIEAPIPGTSYVGVEIPNTLSNSVGLKELVLSEQFQAMSAVLPLALGEDVKGQPIVADLAKMPHLLIAGATGTGKSVCINAIITTLLLSHTPDTLRFLMIDPKMVELSTYDHIPHLHNPVVTDVEEAERVLDWCVQEMERRYRQLNRKKVRDIYRYNAQQSRQGEKTLPYVVVIIDEMADLMMAAPQEVERSVCRLAQMARAVGIHLIIATQRPSVDVITGLIKANFPARIAFAVSSQTDSRVIIDTPGAERLLGKGDMLFAAPDAKRSGRLQGTWVSDEEIHRVVDYWHIAQQDRVAGDESLPATPEDLPVPNQETDKPDPIVMESDQQVLEEPPSSIEATPAQAWVPPTQKEPVETVQSEADDETEEDEPEHKDSEVLAETREEPPSLAESRPEEEPTDNERDAVVTPPASEPDEEMQVMPDTQSPAPTSAESLYTASCQLVQNLDRCSISLLQRKLKIGQSKALELVNQMLDEGVVQEDDLDSQTYMQLVRFQETSTHRPERE